MYSTPPPSPSTRGKTFSVRGISQQQYFRCFILSYTAVSKGGRGAGISPIISFYSFNVWEAFGRMHKGIKGVLERRDILVSFLPQAYEKKLSWFAIERLFNMFISTIIRRKGRSINFLPIRPQKEQFWFLISHLYINIFFKHLQKHTSA